MDHVGVCEPIWYLQDQIGKSETEDRRRDHKPDDVAERYSTKAEKNVSAAEQDCTANRDRANAVVLGSQRKNQGDDKELLKKNLDGFRQEIPRGRNPDVRRIPRFGP